MTQSIDDLIRAKSEMTARYLMRERVHAPAHGTRPLGLVLAAAAPTSNVHAIGVGHKLVDNTPTGDMAVRFYVNRKLPRSMLGDASMLPATIAGLPVDVIQTQPAALAAAPPYQGHVRPVQGGMSIAHFSVTAGTISCICRSTDPIDSPNALFVLSNNHVLADLNRGSAGDVVLQPGPADGGLNPADAVGRLHRFVPVGDGDNVVDAAIAQLDPVVAAAKEIYAIGAPTGVGTPVVGMTLRKQGRTTGLTTGTVSDISLDATIDMGGGSTAVFHSQIRVNVGADSRYIALPGDSGSLFVDPENAAIGLLFACPADGSYALACRFTEVQDRLKVRLWTQE